MQFQSADTDLDKHLDAEEFTQLEIDDATFSAIDADNDERISADEIVTFTDQRAL